MAVSTEGVWPEGLGFKFGKLTWMPEYEHYMLAAWSPKAGLWSATGHINLGLEVEVPIYNGPIVIPIFGVPVPVGFCEVFVEGGFTAGLELTEWSSASTAPKLNGTLDLGLALGVSANIGYEGLSVGLWAKGGPEMGFQFPEDPMLRRFGLMIAVGYQGEFLGVVIEGDLWDYTWWLIGGEEAGQATALAPMLAAAPLADRGSAPAWRTPSRDYLSAPKTLRTLALGDGASCVQAGVYPYARCRLALLGGGPVLVWTRDNPARAPENRTELVWQRRSGGVWSGVQALKDDGTGDFLPDLDAAGTGRVVAVWQSLNRTLAPGEQLPASMAAAEVAAGVLDAGSGNWTVTNLTTDTNYDRSLAVAGASNGTALAVWISNAYTNMLGSAVQPNALRAARFDGVRWTAVQTVAAGLGAVLSTDVAYDGQTGRCVCVVDLDDDLTTEQDQELFGAVFTAGTWSPLAQLTTNACRDASARLVRGAAGGASLAWIQATNLVYAANAGNLAAVDLVAGPEVAGRALGFEVAAGADGRLAVVWEDLWAEAAGMEADPAFLFRDPAEGLWSRRLRLPAAAGHIEKHISPAFSADGALMAGCIAAEVATNAPSPTHLLFLEHEIGSDLTVTADAFETVPARFGTGDVVQVTARLDNGGERVVRDARCAFYHGDPACGGQQIGATQTIAGPLVGGTGVWMTVAWSVPSLLTNGTLYVVADPGNTLAECCETNNVACLRATGPDLTLVGPAVLNETTNSRLLKATVLNAGAVPAPAGVTVTFRRGGTNGVLLAEEQLGVLAPGTNGVYDAGFRWDMSGQTFTTAYEVVYIAVDPINALTEVDERDNTAAVQVMTSLDSDGDGLLDGEEIRLGTRTDRSDTDADGLGDAEEVRTYGTNPLAADSDGDGAKDGDEIAAGTDPNSATDVFKIVAADGTVSYRMAVTWSAKSGQTYRVQAAPSVTGAWANAPSGGHNDGQSLRTAGSNGVLRYVDGANAPGSRFYRVKLGGP
jgi:hypothetical protein